jgi:hypothetical protein
MWLALSGLVRWNVIEAGDRILFEITNGAIDYAWMRSGESASVLIVLPELHGMEVLMFGGRDGCRALGEVDEEAGCLSPLPKFSSFHVSSLVHFIHVSVH